MRRLTVPVIAAILVVVAAVAVVAVVVWPDSDSESVDDAMAVMPADAEMVMFTDTAATRERLGFGDLTSDSSEGDVDDFVTESLDDAPWGVSSLGSHFAAMEDWGWNWADVQWEAEYHADDAYATAFKLRDDLDMDVVTETFEEQGYERSDVEGHPAYLLDDQDVPEDEQPVVSLQNVVVLPDDHLLLTGDDAETLLDPATGEAESLADSELVGDLTDALGDPEYANLTVGESSCIDALDGLGSTGTPEGEAAVEDARDESPGYADFHDITGYATAVTVVDDEPVGTAVAGYADADAAAADVDPRAAYLEEGVRPANDQPYTELFTADVESDGSAVRYDLDGDDMPRLVPWLIQGQELPWAFCAPNSDG